MLENMFLQAEGIAVGLVVVVVVIGILVGIGVTKLKCKFVRDDYTRNAGAAATKYGFPTFAAWLAAQSWWVRKIC